MMSTELFSCLFQHIIKTGSKLSHATQQISTIVGSKKTITTKPLPSTNSNNLWAAIHNCV